jgi:hypothetical protein
VKETTGGVMGVLEGGTRAPNEFGLFDLHGNVWERTNSGSVRSGSWSANLFHARAANSMQLALDVSHGLVGVRFVLKD